MGQKKSSRGGELLCDSHRIQTCNLLIRSQMLYSVELANHFAFASAKLSTFSVICKFFSKKNGLHFLRPRKSRGPVKVVGVKNDLKSNNPNLKSYWGITLNRTLSAGFIFLFFKARMKSSTSL